MYKTNLDEKLERVNINIFYHIRHIRKAKKLYKTNLDEKLERVNINILCHLRHIRKAEKLCKTNLDETLYVLDGKRKDGYIKLR